HRHRNFFAQSIIRHLRYWILEWEKLTRILIPGYEGPIPRVFMYEQECESIILNDTSLNRIDLSELHRLGKLKSLDLSGNKIERIDLKYLERCHELSSLNLSNNCLTDIDLSPLTKCKKLAWLSLSQNQISHIDLMPIGRCDELEHLLIHGNRFEEIDLSPLSSCRSLRELAITTEGDPGFDEVETALDLRPLSGLRRLKKVHIAKKHHVTLGLTQVALREKPRGVSEAIKRSKNVSVEKLVKHQAKKRGIVKALMDLEDDIADLPASYWYTVRRHILKSKPYELEIISGYDGRISDLVKEALAEGKDWGNLTIAKVADEISKGASSILFDIDEIPMTLPSHGKLRAAILASRTNEIREARIFVCEKCVDFREVWYTAWGFRMLKQEGQWIFGTSGSQLIELRDRLRELGFGLTFKQVKIRDEWPSPRNEPSMKVRQTILGFVDKHAQSSLKDRAMQCILKSPLHPLRIELERIMTEIYGGEA
ncbi:MAG: leucine-rich repeat domain-containing protein, partial [Candidatus Thorarchaeota archaeon]